MALSGGLTRLDVDLRRIRKDVYEFSYGDRWLRFTTKKYVRRIVDEARRIMVEAIGERVYAIPPTDDYVRTQRLWQGVRTRDFDKGTAAGEVYIDRSVRGKNFYFYPLSVEFGLESHRRYYGRHFWRSGMPRIHTMFEAEVAKMFGETKEFLRF